MSKTNFERDTVFLFKIWIYFATKEFWNVLWTGFTIPSLFLFLFKSIAPLRTVSNQIFDVFCSFVLHFCDGWSEARIEKFLQKMFYPYSQCKILRNTRRKTLVMILHWKFFPILLFNFCSFTDKPYLLYFDVRKCIRPQLLALQACPTPSVCVSECPTYFWSPASPSGVVINGTEIKAICVDDLSPNTPGVSAKIKTLTTDEKQIQNQKNPKKFQIKKNFKNKK